MELREGILLYYTLAQEFKVTRMLCRISKLWNVSLNPEVELELR